MRKLAATVVAAALVVSGGGEALAQEAPSPDAPVSQEGPAPSPTGDATTSVVDGEVEALDGTWTPLPGDVLPAGAAGALPSFQPARASSQRSLPKLSDIQVTYVGFGPKAKEAFEYAVSAWERLVRSPVPIRVRAEWTSDLPDGALAAGGSNGGLVGFAGAPLASTAYPLALADARAGRDLAPNVADLFVDISSTVSWRTATDGSGPGYDLVTVAMHELAHGLGFSSTFDVANGLGTRSTTPTAYDRLVTDAGGARLVDIARGTTTLAAKLQSDALRFSGAQAVAAHGSRVPLHSPDPFEDGSSVSHFGVVASRDALLTPSLAPGVANHDPGDVALGVLRDLGWTTTTSRLATVPVPSLRWVSAGNGTVDVSWAPLVLDRGVVSGYWVERFVDGSSTPAESVSVLPPATSVRFTGLPNGSAHRFRVRASSMVGDSAFTSLSQVARPLRLGPFANVDAFLARQYQDIVFRAPSPGALESRRTAVNAGTATPGATIVALLGDATHTSSVPPTIRLYLAYFTRLPDEGGLAYWSRKAREGTSLHRASEQFARSTEFQRTYGSLTNGAFVDLVYRNVLGRAPDAGGRSYWVGKLDRGFPRGSMMITVSESSENVRKTQAKVDVVGLQHAIMRRVPAPTAVDADVARLAGGTSLATLAEEVLQSRDYSRRIRGVNPLLPVDLAPAVELAAVSSDRVSMASGDVDGDGNADLVAATPTLLVRLAGSATNRTTSDSYRRVELGDVDDDGDLDLVALPTSSSTLVLRRNDGTGAFGTATTVTAEQVAAYAVGDVTGDGIDDVVTAAPADDGLGGIVRVHRLGAAGAFTTTTRAAHVAYDTRMEIGDVTGDGRADLALLLGQHNDDAGDYHTPELQVVRQLADGTLGAPTRASLSDGSEVGPLELADTTGDGVLDLVVGVRSGTTAEPAAQTWRATSGTPVQHSSRVLPDEVVALASADLTGDGRTDVISARYVDVAVFVQQSTGGLAAPVSLPVGDGWSGSPSTPGGAELVDLDLDGYLDLVAFGGTGFRSGLLAFYQR